MDIDPDVLARHLGGLMLENLTLTTELQAARDTAVELRAALQDQRAAQPEPVELPRAGQGAHPAFVDTRYAADDAD